MLKRKYQPNAGEKYYNERSDTEEAIDTVVEALEKPLPTDENIKLFSEWCGKFYIRCEGGWWHRYNPQTLENIITTDTLLKWWNERNYTEKETTE